MPSLSNHHSSSLVKLLLLGDAKCLAGDTIVKVTRGRSIGKAKTLQQLYQSPNHPYYDHDLDTYLLCDMGGYVGLNVMEDIIYSGVKEVMQITTKWGDIRATPEHKFLTENGWWKTASELRVGDKVKHWIPGPGKDVYPRRAMIYSVKYHPYAHQMNIEGYGNYGRISLARGVVEAALNNLDIEDYKDILRNDWARACTLTYIPKDWDIHHKDHDRTNDELSNLEPKPEPEHVHEHDDDRTRTSKATSLTPIISITSAGKTSTYDVVMADPHNNFIANGFVVHNSGKTTSLASLVTAGYKLRILDFDNLLDTLAMRIRNECPENLDNVEYRSLRDSYKGTLTGTLIDGKPKAWIDSLKLLNRWQYDDVDLGIPGQWGSDVILVIDSLSRWCDSAYDFHDAMTPKGKSGEADGRAIYGNAQDDVERQLANLTSPSFNANVIVICHGNYMAQADGTTKIFPQGVGQKLSMKIPQYFPNYIRLTKRGEKRTLQLKSDAMIDLANTRPDIFTDRDLDPSTGLAEFFAVLKGQPAKIEGKPSTKPVPTLVRR